MANIFYRKFGKGYPVILIHGFCETHEIWSDFTKLLFKKFQIFIIDLPGFGNSPLVKTPFSIEDIASQVDERITEEKIDKPIVIGHSLGGYVTLAMAAKHPAKFAGIGLFQSTAFPDSDERKANRNRVIEFVNKYGTTPFIDTYVPGLFLDKKHHSIRTVDKIARNTRTETLLAYTEAMRDRKSSIDFIRKFEKPLLILGGDKDNIIPQEITMEHGRVSSNPKLYIMKDTAHMAMYECPEKAGAAVEEFVDEIISKLNP